MEEIELESAEALSQRGRMISREALQQAYPSMDEMCMDAEKELNSQGKFHVPIPKVHVRVLDSKDLGACVVKHNSKIFIGVRFGSYFVLQGLFYRMYASPKLFLDIGDPTKEVEREKVFHFEITDLIDYVSLVWEDVVPRDKDRQDAANHLIMYSLMFLVFHELGHALLGHIDYKIAVYNENKFEEVSNDKEHHPLIKAEYSQFFELDADRFSAWENLKRMREHVHVTNFSTKQKEKAMTLYVRHWAFSFYSLCKLFGRSEPDAGNLLKSTHPSPGTKQLNLSDVIKSFYTLKNMNKDPYYINPYDMLQLLKKTFAEVEEAFAEVSETEYTSDFVVNRKHVIAHFEYLKSCFEDANKLVKPFAIVKRR